MQQAEALAFAHQWAAAWSKRDVVAVLNHFADDVQFTSPIAHQLMGTSTVRGKAALAEYWQQALTQIQQLLFTVESIVFDSQTQRLAIIYISQTETRTVRASEIMQFGEDGKIIKAEALYGAPVTV
jgi:ketosteroid isomerase-like protein